MAVSIDRVYQKVLAFANKEQRGYITPQEFNLFADQAQMEIFEQYFYDLSQFKRVPGNNHEYSDIVSIIKDKISLFEHWQVGGGNITVANKYGDCIAFNTDIPDLYRLGEIAVSYPAMGKYGVCEQLAPKEFSIRTRSKLATFNENRPVFVKRDNQGQLRIKIYPYPKTVGFVDSNGNAVPDGGDITTATKKAGVSADYTRKPKKPNWGYVVVNDKALYNSTASQNFELHASEESELVYRILAFAGIAIEKPQLTQVAAGLGAGQIQQEKQ
tara:strand:- start:979 stop:1791 length:813 start_codon:yes stop_codon:yes gene_type:complete